MHRNCEGNMEMDRLATSLACPTFDIPRVHTFEQLMAAKRHSVEI